MNLSPRLLAPDFPERRPLSTALAGLRLPLAAVILAAPGPSQSTWYVDVNGTPPGTGSQADPYVTIGLAHDAAPTLDGDTILVAPGVYEEGSLALTKDVAVVASAGPLQTHLVNTQVDLGTFQLPGPLLEGFTISHEADMPVAARMVEIFYGTLRRCVLRDTSFTALFIVANATVERTTIVGNERGIAGFGLGFFLTMRNTVIWGNEIDASVNDQHGSTDYCAGAYPTPFGSPGTGNLPGDPGLWSLTLGDYRLRTGSPCIDAGDPASPRDPDGSVADIGAIPYDALYQPAAYSFCSTSPHSVGDGARMSLDGSLGLADNGFSLLALECPPDRIGLFFYGPNEIQVAFGDGFRCVGGMTTRVYPALFADGAGTARRDLDFTQPPASGGSGMITAGSTWKFQFWFRDPMGPGGSGYNLTDGISVTFSP